MITIPCYEYRCDNNHLSERIRPFRESNNDDVCPKCGEVAKRIMSVPSPAHVPGGTRAGMGQHYKTLGEFDNNNEWVDA